MAGTRTRIDAWHVIAYQHGRHRYLRDGVIVIEGNNIVRVGRQYDEPADQSSPRRFPALKKWRPLPAPGKHHRSAVCRLSARGRRGRLR